jgi:3-oxoadipate enol-lactonase
MSVPVMYIAGAVDLGAPPPVMEAMANATPGAKYRVIPDSAHIANLNQPDAFTTALSEFLEF